MAFGTETATVSRAGAALVAATRMASAVILNMLENVYSGPPIRKPAIGGKKGGQRGREVRRRPIFLFFFRIDTG